MDLGVGLGTTRHLHREGLSPLDRRAAQEGTLGRAGGWDPKAGWGPLFGTLDKVPQRLAQDLEFILHHLGVTW